ncbi:MAG: phosphoheptose isomerase [Chlamydiota bacterium]|jgi:D-sedoheptulose 7-phosphate isomerase
MTVITSLEASVEDVIRAAHFLKKPESLSFIENVVRMLASCLQQEKKILIAGNGGSLCDAMHFAEELTGQFRTYRRALAAIALSDPSHMSCVANDMGFENVFARGVEALGQAGDVLILMTTSGNSSNLLQAQQMADRKGLSTVAFLGKNGGKLKGLCDLEWVVDGFSFSDRIQEAHMAALHLIVEQVEAHLFGV